MHIPHFPCLIKHTRRSDITLWASDSAVSWLEEALMASPSMSWLTDPHRSCMSRHSFRRTATWKNQIKTYQLVTIAYRYAHTFLAILTAIPKQQYMLFIIKAFKIQVKPKCWHWNIQLILTEENMQLQKLTCFWRSETSFCETTKSRSRLFKSAWNNMHEHITQTSTGNRGKLNW